LSQPAESLRPEPREEYARRLDAARAQKARLDTHEQVLGNARVLVFFAGLVTLYIVFVARIISPWWLLLPVGLFLMLLQRYDRLRGALVLAERMIGYYEKGLARLSEQWVGTGDPGTAFLDDHHPYAPDLDLFGRGSVFERVSTARTRAGGRRLADWLGQAAEPDEVRSRQGAVQDLRPRLDLRRDLAMLGADVPEGVDLDGLVAWGAEPPILYAPKTRIFISILVAVGLGCLALWFVGDLPLSAYMIVLLIEGAVALALKNRAGRVIEPIDRRSRDLAVFAGLLARIESERFEAPRLIALQKDLLAHRSPPSRRIRQLLRLVDWLGATHNPYLRLAFEVTLGSIQLAFALDAWRRESGPEIGRWLATVAEFEALSSLAGYAYENPDDPFPEVVADGPCFEGESLGHPLLPRARCIRNDVQLGGERRLFVVSGSNMSGKSTLLRTVGVNAALALAGAPVRARRLRLSTVSIGATLRIQDSLQAGQSRFYAEITRVRQLVDLARGQRPLLFLLDEIFHGTNSHDRRQGAEAVVKGLIHLGAIGFVTTHDLALTQIVQDLAPKATNVHFEDRMVDGKITFDYTMRPGVVEHSNAIALMRAVGLEV
jgi:hypothetical protein